MQEYNSSGAPKFWYTMNFNDYGSGLITLFHQMVINNWFVTVDMYSYVMGEENEWWIKFYFISFWITIVLIQLNILIAIFLEIFGAVADQVNDYFNKVKTQ